MIGLAVVSTAIAVYETLRERFTASIFTGPMVMVGLGLLLGLFLGVLGFRSAMGRKSTSGVLSSQS